MVTYWLILDDPKARLAIVTTGIQNVLMPFFFILNFNIALTVHKGIVKYAVAI